MANFTKVQGMLGPRVRVRLARSYYEHDDMILPKCLAQFIPPQPTRAILLRFSSPWDAIVSPKGQKRRIGQGWRKFVQDCGFNVGDILDIIIWHSDGDIVGFVLINDDPEFADTPIPPALYESA